MPDTPQGQVTLAIIQEDIRHLEAQIAEGFAATTRRIDSINGTVREHDRKIAVLEAFCANQMIPALKNLDNLRLEFAKAGFYTAGGILGVVAIVAAAAKAVGWW